MGYLLDQRDPPKTKQDAHARRAKRAIKRAVKAGVDPLIQRVAAHDGYDGLAVIERDYTTRQIIHALRWLDALEAARPDPPKPPKP